tara:strand:+ start:1085 stop:1747 length:663 start_codon:yes stop_codon:yes gene_type:complete
MLKNFFIIYFFVIVLVLSGLGLRGCKSSRRPLELFPDMDHQAKFGEQSTSDFFADGRTDRPRVPGAVPTTTVLEDTYAHLSPPDAFNEDDYFVSGKDDQGEFGSGFPIAITNAVMEAGEQNFNLYCAICHGTTGDGNGVLKNPRYGFATIASLLQQRIMDQPEGEIFNTITWGLNTMGAYGAKLRPEERWQVVLYVRALQRAASGSIEDVPAEHRGDLGL